MSGEIVFEVRDRVGLIRLNRPEKLNAFTNAMLEDWLEALDEAEAREDVRCTVITGTGRGFTTGGDVSTMGEGRDNSPRATKDRIWETIQAVPKRLATMDTPTIAAVNGVATGGGVDVALACDIRVCAASARFAETYARLGLIPGAGGAYFLPRTVGVARALELLWTAEFIDAETAERIGLVNHVYPDESFLDDAMALAGRIAAAAPLSVRYIKRTVYRSLATDMLTSFDLVSSHMTVVRSSEDHVEAVAAFREKREPEFKGR